MWLKIVVKHSKYISESLFSTEQEVNYMYCSSHKYLALLLSKKLVVPQFFHQSWLAGSSTHINKNELTSVFPIFCISKLKNRNVPYVKWTLQWLQNPNYCKKLQCFSLLQVCEEKIKWTKAQSHPWLPCPGSSWQKSFAFIGMSTRCQQNPSKI